MFYPRLVRARRARSGHDRRAGAALVEFALVFPVFMMLILGTIEVGRALMVYQLLNNAAREGARAAILPTTTSDAQVRARVVNYLAPGKVPTDERLTVNVTVNGGGSLAGADYADEVQVSVSVSHSDVSLMTPKYLGNLTMTGTANMRHE